MSRRALLGAGLLTLAGVGGVGGDGVGLLPAEGPRLAGTAAPLPMTVTSGPSATPSPPAPPPKKIVPGDTEALNKDDLEYRVREFTATSVVRSDVRLKVPRDWGFTQP